MLCACYWRCRRRYILVVSICWTRITLIHWLLGYVFSHRLHFLLNIISKVFTEQYIRQIHCIFYVYKAIIADLVSKYRSMCYFTFRSCLWIEVIIVTLVFNNKYITLNWLWRDQFKLPSWYVIGNETCLQELFVVLLRMLHSFKKSLKTYFLSGYFMYFTTQALFYIFLYMYIYKPTNHY